MVPTNNCLSSPIGNKKIWAGMPPVKAIKLEKPEKPHQPIALDSEDLIFSIFLIVLFWKKIPLKYLIEVIRASIPIIIKIYLSSR